MEHTCSIHAIKKESSWITECAPHRHLQTGLIFQWDQLFEYCLSKPHLYSEGKWILKEHGQAFIVYAVCGQVQIGNQLSN